MNQNDELYFKKQLDEEVDALDGATLSQLSRMRKKALASQPSRWNIPLFAGAASFASAALLVIILTPSSPLMEEDSDWIVSVAPEVLDLYKSLDFYEWLAEQEQEG